jgi:hypothetical protein
MVEMIVKAISLHQPYASLVATGAKEIETRTWSTAYRGEIMIVSTLKPAIPGFLCGYALALVDIIGCRKMSPADVIPARCCYDPKAFAWLLQNARQFVQPFRCRGYQRIYEVDVDVEIR